MRRKKRTEDDFESALFNKSGKRIEIMAQIFTWLGFLFAIVFGFLLFLYGFFNLDKYWYLMIVAPFFAIFSCLGVYIWNLLLFGFGELVDQARLIEENTHEQENSFEKLVDLIEQIQTLIKEMKEEKTKEEPEPVEEDPNTVKCKYCGKRYDIQLYFCPKCEAYNPHKKYDLPL